MNGKQQGESIKLEEIGGSWSENRVYFKGPKAKKEMVAYAEMISGTTPDMIDEDAAWKLGKARVEEKIDSAKQRLESARETVKTLNALVSEISDASMSMHDEVTS